MNLVPLLFRQTSYVKKYPPHIIPYHQDDPLMSGRMDSILSFCSYYSNVAAEIDRAMHFKTFIVHLMQFLINCSRYFILLSNRKCTWHNLLLSTFFKINLLRDALVYAAFVTIRNFLHCCRFNSSAGRHENIWILICIKLLPRLCLIINLIKDHEFKW